MLAVHRMLLSRAISCGAQVERTGWWGDGSDGQLGHTPTQPRSRLMNSYVELLPRSLEPMSGGAPVRSLAGGLNHTLCADGDGALSPEDLRGALAERGVDVSPQKLSHLYSLYCRGDGKLELVEFANLCGTLTTEHCEEDSFS